MSYVKYNEDDIKINDNRVFMTRHIEEKRKEVPLLFACPYCDQVFESKSDLFRHVKHDHNIFTPIILINGTIPQNEDEIYVSEVNSVVVKSYEVGLQVIIDNEIQSSDGNEVFELTSIVKEHLDKGFCVLYVSQKRIVIRTLSVDAIENPRVFETIKSWQQLTIENKTIANDYPSDINEAEKIYLDAFFNYFVACRSEGSAKTERYYDAYALLSIFSNLNSMALCVLKVIAFRLNWFAKLKLLSVEDDDFKIITKFMHCKFNDSIKKQNLTGQLYIEDELQSVIECIVKYYCQDYEYVDNYLNRFSNAEDITDINFKDKIFLLKGRRSKDKGISRDATYYYRQIKDEFLNRDRLVYEGVNSCE